MRISDWSSDVCSSDLEPGDARDTGDAALQAAARDEDNDVDRLGDQPARNGDHRLLHKAFDPVEGGHRAVGMDSGDAAGVPGIPSFQHVERFGAANLAHDDAIGAQAQRRTAQVGHCDRSEEHTSELRTLMRTSYAVYCLKKKNTC